MQIKWWYFLSLGVIFIDLLTKHLLDGQNYGVIDGFFSVVTVHNTGASWGVLAGAQWFFILISVVFLVGMLLFDFLYKKDFGANAWYRIGFTLVLGGLIGNLFDRIVFGYVRDFIHLDFMSFPVFNVADMALTIGCICILIFLVFFCRFGEKEGDTILIKKSENNIEKNLNNSKKTIENLPDENTKNEIEKESEKAENLDQNTKPTSKDYNDEKAKNLDAKTLKFNNKKENKKAENID